MSEGIIIALIGALGAVVVAVPTIIINRSSNVKQRAIFEIKLENLTKAVEKHNSVIERVFILEKKADVFDEKICVANHRIDDLENK